MENKSNDKVPVSAKVWWGLTWIVMLVLLVMLGRNFVGSIIFGTSTDNKVVDQYYQTGLKDGLAGQENSSAPLALENPLFVKAYSKGYREGLDKKWQDEK